MSDTSGCNVIPCSHESQSQQYMVMTINMSMNAKWQNAATIAVQSKVVQKNN